MARGQSAAWGVGFGDKWDQARQNMAFNSLLENQEEEEGGGEEYYDNGFNANEDYNNEDGYYNEEEGGYDNSENYHEDPNNMNYNNRYEEEYNYNDEDYNNEAERFNDDTGVEDGSLRPPLLMSRHSGGEGGGGGIPGIGDLESEKEDLTAEEKKRKKRLEVSVSSSFFLVNPCPQNFLKLVL